MPPATADGTLSHLAFFYRDRAGYLDQIQAFAAEGLAAGEPVLIAVPRGNYALLRDHLDAGRGYDVSGQPGFGQAGFSQAGPGHGAPGQAGHGQAGSKQAGSGHGGLGPGGPGRLGFVDMAEFGRNPARIIPGVRAFFDSFPGQRVRYVGEPVWPGRSDAEMREACRHEALINLAFASLPATILCPYDAAGLAAPILGRAEQTHPSILASGRRTASARYAGPGCLPPGCDAALPVPPAGAQTLSYSTDLRPLRRLVAGHAQEAGLDEERAGDLLLAVSEVAANTLRHTEAGGTVHVWHDAGEILCQVQDRGWITDPLAGRVRRPADSRGHGLWVVNQLCDLAELRTGAAGTTVRMHMRLNVP